MKVVTCTACGTTFRVFDKFDAEGRQCAKCGARVAGSEDEQAMLAWEPPPRPADAPLELLLFERVEGVGVVRFGTSSVLQGHKADQVGEELAHLVNERRVRLMLVNLGNVKHMGSMVVGKLFGICKLIQGKGGALKLCCIDPDLMEVFRILKFDKLAEVYETEAEGVASFKAKW